MKNGLIAFKDYSVHFTLKGQTLEQIKEAFDILLMTESLVKETDDVLHHCFLPRIVVEQRGWTTEVLDFLRQINPFKFVGIEQQKAMLRIVKAKKKNQSCVTVGLCSKI